MSNYRPKRGETRPEILEDQFVWLVLEYANDTEIDGVQYLRYSDVFDLIHKFFEDISEEEG